jgi:hypothetical protein
MTRDRAASRDETAGDRLVPVPPGRKPIERSAADRDPHCPKRPVLGLEVERDPSDERVILADANDRADDDGEKWDPSVRARKLHEGVDRYGVHGPLSFLTSGVCS